MAKYLFLKHYRGGPTPLHATMIDEWSSAEVEAHIAFMRAFNDRLAASGEFVDAQALLPEGTFVRSGGPGKPLVTDGPFAETKDLIAGWIIVDVDSRDRAHELAAELSAAPGEGGEPLLEWIEVRPFMGEAPTVGE